MATTPWEIDRQSGVSYDDFIVGDPIWGFIQTTSPLGKYLLSTQGSDKSIREKIESHNRLMSWLKAQGNLEKAQEKRRQEGIAKHGGVSIRAGALGRPTMVISSAFTEYTKDDEEAVRIATGTYGIDNHIGSRTTERPSTTPPAATPTNAPSSPGDGPGGTTPSRSTSTTPDSSTTTTDGGGPSDRLPGGYEVWDIDGELHLIYTLPGSNAPMAWRVDGKPEAILGDYKVRRTLTGKEAAARGTLVMGRHSDLKNSEKDPFDNFLDQIEERSKIEPWLLDPEIIVQSAEAYLEGRVVTIGDLRETEWYNSRTDKEREWIAFAAQSSPAELESVKEDNRTRVKNLLLQAGVSDPPAQLVDYLSNADLTGKFSNVQFTQQITAIADPYSGIEIDPEVKKALKGVDLVTSASDIRDMRSRVKDWIGPFADSYTDRQLEEWAGMLRNDPNGEAKLEDILRGQRMALLPEYDNPDIKWSDAAAPWKSYLAQQWGETVDDDDKALLQIVRANDVNEAARIANEVGLKRGAGGTVNKVTDALSQAFGSGVRGSI